MKYHQYLIIGGGMAADAAVRGIRKIDRSGTIGLIGDECDPPYERPPLSKALWRGAPPASIWCNTQELDVDLYLGNRVVALDPASKTATDVAGNVFTYEKLLLATGSSPRRLPDDGHSVIYFRTAADYRKLRELAERGKEFVVLGGGFIGTEIAAALALNGKHVTLIIASAGIGARVYPPALVTFLTAYYQERGVTVLPSTTVSSVRTAGDRVIVTTSSGAEIMADGVVAGLGATPNTELAAQAGLAVDDGIVVDELLRTSNPDIYAAGDVANFYSAAMGRRMRVQHEDNALVMGETAGGNMAGGTGGYRHQPYFYSDLFDLGYEAVGELDARLELVEDWRDGCRKGVVYYLRDGRVSGVLLWNTWGQVATATRLLADRTQYSGAALAGRITG